MSLAVMTHNSTSDHDAAKARSETLLQKARNAAEKKATMTLKKLDVTCGLCFQRGSDLVQSLINGSWT
jgi:hypothetical protein